MLHHLQTVIPSFCSSSIPPPPPSSFLQPLLSSHSFCQVEKEELMEYVEVALKKGFRRPETLSSLAQGLHAEDMVWAVERSNLLLGSDDSIVEELLNLGELTEPEKEEGEEAKEAYFEAYNNSNSSSALSFDPPPPLTFHAPDPSDFDWVSNVMYGSVPEFPPPCSGVPPYHHHPSPENQTQKPAPSLTSPTVCSLSTEALVPVSVKAKRSKRPRTAVAGVWSICSPPPFTDSSTTTSSHSSSSSCSSPSYSSYLIYDHAAAGITTPILLGALPKKNKPKKRGRKPKSPPQASYIASTAGGERRCSHCGVQKTPQWRAGPLGAKTLCNACGVRFKSGRLLPEYRPACSPTFVSHVHSNSHRKVLEMRRKKEEQPLAPPVPSF